MPRHCPQCGGKVEEGEKFCRQCGYSLRDDGRFSTEGEPAGEPAGMPSGESAAEPMKAMPTQRRSLRERLAAPVRLGWTFVPLYAAIIIGLLATAGAAYAAFMLYENVIEPAITQSRQQAEEPEEDAAEGAEEPEGSDEAPEEEVETGPKQSYVAEGKPQSALQVAEILAMDPTEVPAYLEGQGLVRMDGTTSAMWSSDGVEHQYTRWGDADGTGALAKAIEDAGLGASFSDGYASYFGVGSRISLGGGLSFLTDAPSPSAYADDLLAGERQSSILLSSALTEPLDEEGGKALAVACGFESEPQYWSFARAEGEYGYGSPKDVAAWAGAVSVNGADSVWYIRQESYSLMNSDSDCYLLYVGCVPLTEAESELIDESEMWQEDVGTDGIATPSELAGADLGQKALWFAQLLVQRGLDCQGVPFVNVVTGEAVTYRP